jgi:hypothetical protein
LTLEQPSKSKSVFASHNFPPKPRQEELLSVYMKGIPTSPVHVTKDTKLRDVFFGSDDSHKSKYNNRRIHKIFFNLVMQDMTVSEFTQDYSPMQIRKITQFGANSVEAVYNAIYTLDD